MTLLRLLLLVLGLALPAQSEVLYAGRPQGWFKAKDTYRDGPVFETLPAALAAAHDGDTIIVLVDVDEPLTIDKRVDLLGYGLHERPEVRAAMTVTADGVLVDRLHFKVPAAPSLTVTGARGVRVTSCFFIESPGGIEFRDCHDAVFEENSMLFAGGLRLLGGGGHLVRGNQLDSGDIYGVRVEASAGNRFVRNHVRRAGWVGLLLHSKSSGTLLEENLFEGSDIGLSIQTDDNVVRGNTFLGCRRGLALTRSPFGKSVDDIDSVVYIDSPDGSARLDIRGNLVEGNSFRSCLREAVLFKEARHNVLRGNRVEGAGERGFVLMGGSDANQLADNEVLGTALPLLVLGSEGNVVEGGMAPAARLPERENARLAEARRPPDGSDRLLLFGDFHTHSLLSDGASTLDELFTYASDVAGLDFTAISDHGEYVGHGDGRWEELEATVARHQLGQRFTAIPGFETTFVMGWSGHFNVYFAGPGGRPAMAPHGGRAWIPQIETPTPERLLERLRQDGRDTLVIRHHYFATSGFWQESPLESDLMPMSEACSVHAVWSGDRAYDSYASDRDAEVRGHVTTVAGALASGRVLGLGGSSDSHYAFPGDGGLTAVLSTGTDAASIFEALRERRCYATTGARIRLGFSALGQPLGSVLGRDAVPAGEAVVEGTAPLEEVVVLEGERVLARAELDGVQRTVRLDWSAPALPPLGTWYQLRVRQGDGQMAWSTPIWSGRREPVVVSEQDILDRERMMLLAYAAVMRAWADLPTPDLANRTPRQALQEEALAPRVRALWPRYVEAAAALEARALELGLDDSREAQRVLSAWEPRFGRLPAPIRVRPVVKPMVDVELVRRDLGL